MRANKTLVIKYFMFDGSKKNCYCVVSGSMHSCMQMEKLFFVCADFLQRERKTDANVEAVQSNC